MEHSILKSVKKTLNIDSGYTAFDTEIIIFINSVFSTLHQLGLGPDAGFTIEDDTAEWEEFSNDPIQLNAVKSYIYLRVRVLFDPPTTSYHLSAMEAQIKELEWRLNVRREDIEWVDPMPEVAIDE